MTDLPSSLGIEAVECVAEGGRSLTVRVTGRWRRRRPELRGQAMLVVETEAGRQRLQAMPEPPSLTGAAPGTWRMSFSVPAALAPALPGRTFLQLGGVMVPLPTGEVAIEAERAEGPSADVVAEASSAEVERLKAELARARAGSDRLRDEIAERERRLRGAEQHVHAERALRVDLEQELAWRTRAAQRDLRVLHDRVADLERELGRMRRAVDEAGHLVAAAQAARVAAERRLAERAPPSTPAPPRPAAGADDARAALTRSELELDRLARGTRPPVASHRPVASAADQALLGRETSMVRRRGERADARVAQLERELAAAREDIEAQLGRSARAYEAIELVRGELSQLCARPPADSSPAPSPPRSPAPAAEPPSRAVTPDPVQAERLSEALARLRERTPVAADEAPEPTVSPTPYAPAKDRPAKPWLGSVFRALAGQDAPAAGRLLLALLPAQRLADPHPVAYDLVLSDVLCAHVTVGSTATHVALDATIRPLSEVDFEVVGDLAGVARLLAAGPVRRRLRWLPSRHRLARIRGERRRIAALDRLVGAELTLRELQAGGVQLDPLLALTVAALMIDPGWTTGERFTIAHRQPADPSPDAYLHVRDGRPPLASAEPPHCPVASALVSPADEVLGALAGATGTQVAGEERPLALLRQWLDRAQSG